MAGLGVDIYDPRDQWPEMLRVATLLTSRLGDITAEDLNAFVRAEPGDTESLVLMGAIPGRGSEADPWYSGAAGVRDGARNQLMAEVIAFANGHGGHLILGIEESGDHPKRAVGI